MIFSNWIHQLILKNKLNKFKLRLDAMIEDFMDKKFKVKQNHHELLIFKTT